MTLAMFLSLWLFCIVLPLAAFAFVCVGLWFIAFLLAAVSVIAQRCFGLSLNPFTD